LRIRDYYGVWRERSRWYRMKDHWLNGRFEWSGGSHSQLLLNSFLIVKPCGWLSIFTSMMYMMSQVTLKLWGTLYRDYFVHKCKYLMELIRRRVF
jgi:hypothetical protein